MKLLIILAAATAPLQGRPEQRAQISGLIVRDAYLPYQVIQRQANPMPSLFSENIPVVLVERDPH